LYEKWRIVAAKIAGNASVASKRNSMSPEEYSASMRQLAARPRPSRRKAVRVTYDGRSVVYSSIQDAADALGVHRQSVHRWVTGQTDTYRKLNITISWYK
jgi:hypothetical protein